MTKQAALNLWRDVLAKHICEAPADLTNRQMCLLLTVYLDAQPHTIRGLAATLRLSKPVVSRALNTLAATGYVTRRRDPDDGRNVFIERTPPGRAYLESLGAIVAEKHQKIITR